jgi:RND family efflux transporter MFP subunit
MKFSSAIYLSAALVVAGCGRHSNDARVTASPLPPARVHVATVRSENVPVVTEVTGTIRPAQRAQLAAKVMGTIDEMPVTLGQKVNAGQLLVKINAGEISARVTQARSQLNAARRDLDRERALLEKGASTADIVHGLEDRFTAAQAMVREAETMLDYTAIRAPFPGVIARKLANAGDLAAPGAPLLELEGTSDFQVEAGLPESLVGDVEVGTKLEVTLPSSNQHFVGEVAELSSSADSSALTVLAKISIPADAKARSGQFARLQVPGPAAPALVVPEKAVSQLGQMQRVFVAGEGNRAVLRLVRTGAAQAGQVEITAGLDANERVVVSPPAGLHEGQPLEIVQ